MRSGRFVNCSHCVRFCALPLSLSDNMDSFSLAFSSRPLQALAPLSSYASLSQCNIPISPSVQLYVQWCVCLTDLNVCVLRFCQLLSRCFRVVTFDAFDWIMMLWLGCLSKKIVSSTLLWNAPASVPENWFFFQSIYFDKQSHVL